jgi:hypothetical protein
LQADYLQLTANEGLLFNTPHTSYYIQIFSTVHTTLNTPVDFLWR